MKKVIFGLIAIVCLFIAGSSINSCYSRKHKTHRYSHAELVEDSVWFTQMLEMCHPDRFDAEFNDVTDVEYYQENEAWLNELEAQFLTIDSQTLANICKVLQKNGKKLTILNIMDEYNQYKHVYDNIKDTEDPPVATHQDTIEEMSKLNVKPETVE